MFKNIHEYWKQFGKPVAGTEKRFPDEVLYLMDKYGNIPLAEAVYLEYNPTISAICPNGNKKKLKSWNKGFRNFCGNVDKCKCRHDEHMIRVKIPKSEEQKKKIREKFRKTSLERYGVEHPNQSDKIQEKSRKTSRERYGVDHHMKVPERAEIILEKNRKTMIQRYGVNHPSLVPEFIQKKTPDMDFFKSEEFKNKRAITLTEKFGTDKFTGLPDIVKLRKDTYFKNHGYESGFHNPEIQEKARLTHKENSGFENPFEHPEIQAKIRDKVIDRTRAHYNSEYIHIFDNPTAFQNALYMYGTDELSVLVNCHYTTILDFAQKFNIQLPPRTRQKAEIQISKFLEDQSIAYEFGNRTILNGKEIDFYLPDHNVGIEFNGLYWHSEVAGGKHIHYHHTKIFECLSHGIRLYMIRDDEFQQNPQIHFDHILRIIGRYDKSEDVTIQVSDDKLTVYGENKIIGNAIISHKDGIVMVGPLSPTVGENPWLYVRQISEFLLQSYDEVIYEINNEHGLLYYFPDHIDHGPEKIILYRYKPLVGDHIYDKDHNQYDCYWSGGKSSHRVRKSP